MSDDLGDGLDLEGSSFDEFEKKDKTLGDLWRDNPMVKLGVVGVAAAGIFGAIMLFGGEETPVQESILPAGSEITAPPGTEAASPAYVAAVEEQNQTRLEEAQDQGGSALPTPIDPPQGRLVVPEQEEEAEDPLQRWRQLQEERLQRELQKSQNLQPAAVGDAAVEGEAVQALADAMASQMQAILENESEFIFQTMSLTDPDYARNRERRLADEARQDAQANAEAGVNPGADGDDAFFEDQDLENLETTLLSAGQILYAQLLTEANTDVPGPVLAQIVSGPLAGSRILGDFKEESELLTLNFNTVIYNGQSLSIDAIAIDPATTLTAMATEVDHRYFRRIILPMAAAFVEGAAGAIAESGLTTVTISGDTAIEDTQETDSGQEISAGVEEAGQELREILDEMAEETKVMVKIHAGTPMGILFLEPVIEDAENAPIDDAMQGPAFQASAP